MSAHDFTVGVYMVMAFGFSGAVVWALWQAWKDR